MGGSSIALEVDLVACDAQAFEFAAHAQVFGVVGVGVERLARLELGVQHHVAGVVDPAHVQADLQTQQAERMAFAGPLLADDGVTMVGSLLAIDFPDREAAQHWLAQEPFFMAGLYASTTVHAFANLWPQKAGFPPA